MDLFLAQRSEPGIRVMLDALASNPAGQAFWRRVGFKPYTTILEAFAPTTEQTDDPGSDPC
jgi:hypothetical protein